MRCLEQRSPACTFIGGDHARPGARRRKRKQQRRLARHLQHIPQVALEEEGVRHNRGAREEALSVHPPGYIPVLGGGLTEAELVNWKIDKVMEFSRMFWNLISRQIRLHVI